MYAGQVVEEADGRRAVRARPQHPYTEGLLAAMPQSARPASGLASIPGRVPTADRDADRLPVPPALSVRDRRVRDRRRSSSTTVERRPRRAASASTSSRWRAPGDRRATDASTCDGALLVRDRRHQALPDPARRAAAHRRSRARGRRRRPRDRARPDPRPGGRVGLGQVDARPLLAPAARPHRRRDHASTARDITDAVDAPDPRASAAACRSCSRTRTRRSTRWRPSPTASPSRCATTST